MLYAAVALQRLRIPLDGRVALVFAPNEETGGLRGSGFLAATKRLGTRGTRGAGHAGVCVRSRAPVDLTWARSIREHRPYGRVRGDLRQHRRDDPEGALDLTAGDGSRRCHGSLKLLSQIVRTLRRSDG
jgi:hypothetical protein